MEELMRRKDREITDRADIAKIIRGCDVCRLAFFDQEYPYIVPLNFGVTFDETNMPTFYFHCAPIGTKIDLMVRNPKVSFELDRGHNLVTGEKACDFSMEYESVCGNGILTSLTELSDKEKAFSILMEQYAPGQTYELDLEMAAATAILKLTVQSIWGKRMKMN